jgi:multiple sugar transport system permease protein
MYAIFNKDHVVVFDFVPTLINYAVVLLGWSRAEIAIESGSTFGVGGTSSYDSRQTIFDSVVIAMGSTALTMFISVLAAYALSRMTFRGRGGFLNWVLGQRFMPPIAIIVPLVLMYKVAGMRDTDSLFLGYVGLILIHALMNLPIAVLLMKSFFDDVPKDVDEAAMIDGATRWQTFRRIVLPMVRGGIAAAAVLCFIFSWTEFLLSLFLTTIIRTVPVKITTFVTSTGSEWGFISALGTAAILPGFIFILLVQRHLVRGLTLGSLKE